MKNINMRIAALFLVAGIGFTACSKKTSTTEKSTATRTAPKQGGAPSFDALLAKMDANKDGKLAKAEAKGPLSADFDTIDSNKDGFITAAEMSNAPRVQGRKPQGGQQPPR